MNDIDPNLLGDGSDPDMDAYIDKHMPQPEPPEPTTENPFFLGTSEVPDAGGYDVFAVMDDGGSLCRPCVLDPTNPVHDERTPTQPCPNDTDGDGDCWVCARSETPGYHPAPRGEPDGWGVVAFEHTGNLDDTEHCDHCGDEIG